MDLYDELNQLNQLNGKEYKERCGHRFIMFFGGLFWAVLIPIAYYLAFDQIMEKKTAEIIFITIAMGILMFGAVVILKNGIVGLIVNGKKHLVLYDDGLQIIVNDGKHKGDVYDIKYEEITEFYFCAHKVSKDKTTGKYYIKENASGIINFYKGKSNVHNYHCVDVYNAASAARFILERLDDGQIDHSSNELDKDGSYSMPKN